MATLTDFRAEVAAVLGLDNTVSPGDQGFIDGWVNEGVADVVMRSKCRQRPATMTLTANTKDYTLPTGVISILNAYITSGGNDYALQQVSAQELDDMRRRGTTANSPVRFYALGGADLLRLYPTPTAADTVNLTYVPRPTTLSAGANTPSEIPTEWHRLVTYFALWRGADFDDDSTSEQGERYRKMYEDGLKLFRGQLATKGNARLPVARLSRRRRALVPHDPSADWSSW